MGNVKYNLSESEINMIKWNELIFVTNASKDIVENTIKISRQIDSNIGINEICELLHVLGFMATWENFQDMRLEIK